MGRRDDLRKAYGSMYKSQQAPKATQKMAEKVCGTCANYLEGAFTGEGRGSCKKIKMNSDILADPPVYDLDSANGYRTGALVDATPCKFYEKQKFIDKDGTECNDPVHRRSLRQFQDQ